MKNKFLIVGGDSRQILCARALEKRGYEVTVYGFSCDYTRELNVSENLTEDIIHNDFILLPLPLTCDNININTPLSDKPIKISDITNYINNNHLVFGGMIPQEFFNFPKNIESKKIYDYAKSEEFLIKNAKITAEGAFDIIFSETSFSVYGSEILILGYGRIGKILAPLAKSLGSNVSVAARKSEDLAWISVNGFNPVKYTDLRSDIEKYNIIVNTVPSRIFGSDLIYSLSKDCLILDLASKPGGIDIETAKKANIKAVWALSIPGKTAPLTSGKIICDTILNIIEG